MKIIELESLAFDHLIRSNHDKRHPFRYVTLATTLNETAEQRMVVNRHFDRSAKSIIIYTDKRSGKVEQLHGSPMSSMLFWHSGQKIQIKMKLRASFWNADDCLIEYKKYPEEIMHSYNTVDAPGTKINNLEKAHQWRDQYSSDYFQVIEFEILEMEVLKLQKKDHLRARYHYENDLLKDAVWLVP